MSVILFTNAVIEPDAVMVKVVAAPIASTAMLCIVVDSHFANIAEFIKLADILKLFIKGLTILKVPLPVNSHIRWIC